MRITGGLACGRTLRTPKTGAVRPTQDRVREALFSILQPELARSFSLPLFFGSVVGGLGVLSRGPPRVTFVEADRRHVATLRENLAFVAKGCPGGAAVVSADAYRWIASYAGEGFTIAFADPPYALGEERGYADVLATLARRNVVRPGGLFVAEMTAVQKAEETPGWGLLRDRTYGKTRLCIWRRGSSQ